MKFLRFAAGALVVAALLSPVVSRAADSDPRVAQLVAASGKALGVAKLASYKTMRINSTVSAIGLTGTQTQYVDLRDGRMAETTNLAPLVQSDGFDGRVTWNSDRTHLVWNDGGDSGHASQVNQAYVASLGLWQPNYRGATVTWAGPKTANGKTYDALSIQPVGSKVPFEMWFDRTTHLPARCIFPNGFTTATLIFSDYRTVRGMTYARSVHIDSTDGNNIRRQDRRREARSARCRHRLGAAEDAAYRLLDAERQDVYDRSDYARRKPRLSRRDAQRQRPVSLHLRHRRL